MSSSSGSENPFSQLLHVPRIRPKISSAAAGDIPRFSRSSRNLCLNPKGITRFLFSSVCRGYSPTNHILPYEALEKQGKIRKWIPMICVYPAGYISAALTQLWQSPIRIYASYVFCGCEPTIVYHRGLSSWYSTQRFGFACSPITDGGCILVQSAVNVIIAAFTADLVHTKHTIKQRSIGQFSLFTAALM